MGWHFNNYRGAKDITFRASFGFVKSYNSRESIERFLSDESNAFVAKLETVKVVYYPETEEDIVEIMQTANRKGLKVTVSGGGTGLTGSRVPIGGGIIVSMERMLKARPRKGCREMVHSNPAGETRIYYDEDLEVAHVAPGISINELAVALPRGMMYPPDPTETAAFLGGTVATNASGARCFFYGPTRNWIRGLRIVLPDGQVAEIVRGKIAADAAGSIAFKSLAGKAYKLNIPGYRMPHVKNAAGLYSEPSMDLIDLFIGCEGLLGIISEVTLRLAKAEKEPASVLAFFSIETNALAYADGLRSRKDAGVLSVEYFDAHALDFIRPEFPELKKRLEGAVMSEVKAESIELLAEIMGLLKEHHAAEDWCALTASDRRDMKEFRHSLPDAVNSYLKQHDSYKIGTDFVVPEGKFREMMAKYREAGDRFRARFTRPGVHHVLFGHIGDCHLHFNFITASDEERAYAKELYLELARAAISLGGTISGEHGVGKKILTVDGKTVPYLELMYGMKGLEEIARVKRELDPNWLLNVGNMVPGEYAGLHKGS